MDNRRWPRVSQKDKRCSTEECNNWCVGNDLCNKCNMAIRRYGSVSGKKVKHTCKNCKKRFVSRRDKAEYCSRRCYNTIPKNRKKSYEAGNRWRQRNLIQSRHRNNLGKKTIRHFSLAETCVSLGCAEWGERHHPDYSKPYEITWLCREHHKSSHAGTGITEFDIFMLRKDEEWEKKYLKLQEDSCYECGSDLKGLEIYSRSIKHFCSAKCSEEDYFRIAPKSEKN